MSQPAFGGNGKTTGRRRPVRALGSIVVAVCLVLDAAAATAADAASGPTIARTGAEADAAGGAVQGMTANDNDEENYVMIIDNKIVRGYAIVLAGRLKGQAVATGDERSSGKELAGAMANPSAGGERT